MSSHFYIAALVPVVLLLLTGCGRQDVAESVEAQSTVQFALEETMAHVDPSLVMPAPNKLTQHAGEFRLTAATRIVATSGARPLADYLRQLLGPATGYPLSDAEPSGADVPAIALVLDDSIEGSEAYRLDVREAGVEIRAATSTGLFWGVQTLRQLLPPEIETNAPINRAYWPIAALSIEDAPAFGYRGMHLDVSRTFFPVSFIKQYVDLLALHKLNYFHWHLTDDQGWRIEIKQFPRLTEVGAWRSGTVVGHTYDKTYLNDQQSYGGFYTQAQIRDIVAYASARHITIIPEIDVPGHASAILQAYPQFGCAPEAVAVQQHFGVFPAVLCPTEETFAFLTQVFTEVAALFPSPYLHVGGDEVKTVQWQQCEPCTALMAREGLKDYFALQGYFIRRVEKIVNALGRKIIGWDEILEGDVAASATITSWRGIEGAIHAAKAGHDAIMAPGSHLYFDHYQSRAIDEPLAIHGLTPVRETYGFQVVPDQLKGTPAEKHILGAQGHLWTEYVRTPAKAEYMILPRLTALSEVVWRGDSGRDWGDFARRLPQQIARFEHMGLNVAKTVYAVNSEVEQRGTGFSVALSVDMPDVDIRYTLDGSTPNHASDVYRQPLQLPAGGKLRARAQHRQSGELFAERRLSLIAHKALGAKIEVNTDADRTWNKMPEHSLVDGVLARDQIFQLDDWATFDGQPVEVVVNFAKATDVQLINLGFNPGRFRDFYSPTRVEVWGSTDKQQWRLLGEATGEALVPPAQLGNAITLKLDAASVKYLKVIAENGAQRFSTEDAKPVPVTLYIDEIVVL